MSVKSTPVMRQYDSIKKEYPDCFLFFRMGDFYEMFGTDAVKASKVLNIALTTRNKNSDNPIPMCGVPFHAIDGYLPKLVKRGYKVALCEQVEDPKDAKGIVKREVVRVVTPGAVMEPGLLTDSENNFLCSVAFSRNGYGLCAVDLSTGLFMVCQFTGEGALDELAAELSRFDPKQIIIPAGVEEKDDSLAQYLFSSWPNIIEQTENWTFGIRNATETLLEKFGVKSLDGFGIAGQDIAVSSAGGALSYLKDTQKDSLTQINRIRLIDRADYMQIDPSTVRSLELVKNQHDGTKAGSLLELIDKSVTPMGARTLRRFILNPLTEISSINKRLRTVRAFFDDNQNTSLLACELSGIGDLERVTGRIAREGQRSPKDLLQLRLWLEKLPSVLALLKNFSSHTIDHCTENWDSLEDIAELLQKAIAENPPLFARDGGAIKKGFDPDLDLLLSLKENSQAALRELEADEREKNKIPGLKIKYNKVYGYFYEVSKRQANDLPQEWIRKQSLVNAERFVSPALKELEEDILAAKEKSIELEITIFDSVVKECVNAVTRIQFIADIIGVIDALSSLALTAHDKDYCEPVINDSEILEITQGRHPVVESVDLGERFVPNDTLLDSSASSLIIITGPNMAGKSTYIRQVAIIVLMAQIGSFVPADRAQIGVCDKIFTRVGAQDHLQKGQSTFMVEMNETATILNNATKKSLIVLDEIGRGTSTFDGISIAWAVAEYIHTISARTLFATHYHELTELAETMPGVKNMTIAVKEWNEKIIFLRKIIEGGADKSYGIQVARLAGLPKETIKRASEVLDLLESAQRDSAGNPKLTAKNSPPGDNKQTDIFIPQTSEVEEELRKIDLANTTPLSALSILHRWKKNLD